MKSTVVNESLSTTTNSVLFQRKNTYILQQLAWFFHCLNSKKNVVSRENYSIWHSLIWKRHLTLSVEEAFSSCFRRLGVQGFSGQSGHSTKPSGHCSIWELNLRAFSNQQQSKTRLHSHTHTIWHIFLPATAICLQILWGWHILSHKKWWEAVQPCTALSKDKGLSGPHQRDVFCR